MDSTNEKRVLATYNKREKEIAKLQHENEILRRALKLMAWRLTDEVDNFDVGIYDEILPGPRPEKWINIFMDRAKEKDWKKYLL